MNWKAKKAISQVWHVKFSYFPRIGGVTTVSKILRGMQQNKYADLCSSAEGKKNQYCKMQRLSLPSPVYQRRLTVFSKFRC
ncbi:hypothetical protein [Erwinia psidii]|uniref:Uncharacterized protein n=1 Tax=Erwinia psidii TaxID=69224 RepID=A0A3N6RW06_9GAMM|nr:hypothetical protein [Erwinia psidii]MCX8962204.1 hypothetical protein [Erwinia psidii]MCX8966736.1 hypothetical protein [Erwinia psidii]RQM37188.1 hypothetical protein EB241_16015 [Erwinia psidii]